MDGDELDAYLAKYRAEVRRETLLEACKAMCNNCKEKIPLIKDEIHFHDTHPSNWFCRASKIRKLLKATDQDRE